MTMYNWNGSLWNDPVQKANAKNMFYLYKQHVMSCTLLWNHALYIRCILTILYISIHFAYIKECNFYDIWLYRDSLFHSEAAFKHGKVHYHILLMSIYCAMTVVCAYDFIYFDVVCVVLYGMNSVCTILYNLESFLHCTLYLLWKRIHSALFCVYRFITK